MTLSLQLPISRVCESLGVRIAIDDFGTGFSSLAYLQRFDVDVLKVDRGFVEHVAKGGDDTAIVESILSLASALDLEVVAEGIEFEAQAHALRRLGCHVGQGWLWAPAEAASDFNIRLGRTSTAAQRPSRAENG